MNKIKFLVNRFDDTIRQNIEINVVGKEDVKSASNNVDKLTSSFSKLYSSIVSGSNFRTISKTLRTDMNNIMSELKKQMGEISSGKFKLSASSLIDKANLYEGTRDKRTNNLSTVNKELSLRQQLLNMAMKGAAELDKEAAAAEKTATAYEKMVNSAKRKPTGTGIGSRSFMNLRNAVKNDDGSLKTRTQADDLDAQMVKESTLLGQLQGLWKTLTNGIKNNTEALKNNNINSKKGEENWKSFSTTLTGTLVRFRIITSSIKRVLSTIYSLYDSAASYEEALNLYTVALGEYAEEGSAWAKKISDALYLDPTNIMQYTGGLYNLVQGLGVGSDAAYVMATNLTQLSYDMSSYLNIDVQSAFEKLQSAITGQSRAVASAGIAMQQASLQELAYTLGINKKVRTMSQAEKTYLRYIQILNSTKNMQGDLARTIITPENALRVIKTQFTLLGRAIGQVFIPIVLKAIPYVMALANTLTALANKLANWAGYKLADIDYSNLKLADTAMEELGETATGTGESISRTLAAFDDLNVVESKSKGSGGTGSNGSVLGELEEYITGYDMLSGLTTSFEKNVSEATKTLQTAWSIIRPILKALIGYKLLNGLTNMIINLKKVWGVLGQGNPLLKGLASIMGVKVPTAFSVLVGWVGTAVSTFTILYDTVKMVIKDSQSIVSQHLPAIIAGIGTLQLAVSALIGVVTKNPVAAIVSALAFTIGDIATAISAYKAAMEEIRTEQVYLKLSLDNTGISLSELPGKFDNLFSKYTDYSEKTKQLVNNIDSSKKSFGDAAIEADNLENELLAHNFDDYVTEIDKLKSANDNLKTAFSTLNNNQRDFFIEQTNRLREETDMTIEEYEKRTHAINTYYDEQDARTKGYLEEFRKIQEEYAKTGDIQKYNDQVKALRDKYSDVTYILGQAKDGFDNVGSSIFESMNMGHMSADEMKTSLGELDEKYKNYKKTIDDTYKSQKDKNDEELRAASGRLVEIEKTGEAYKGEKEALEGLYQTLLDNNCDLTTTHTNDINKLNSTYADMLNTIYTKLEDSGAKSTESFKTVFDSLETSLKGLGSVDMKASATNFFDNYLREMRITAKADSTKTHMLEDGTIVTGYFINGVLEMVKDSKGNVVTSSEATGELLTEGFANGIDSPLYKAKVKDSINNINVLTENAFRSGLDIHSPSKLTTSFGIYLVEGLSEGLKDNAVITQLKTSLNSIIKTIKDTLSNISLDMNLNANVEESFNNILTKLQKFCNSWRNGINSLASNMTRTMNNITIGKDGKVSYTKMPTIRIEKFEDGGYPTSGDLFFANENGVPEYITSIGNRSAVANQDQMVSALSGAIITAMSRIPTNTQPGITQVYIGNDKVYEGQGTYQSRQTDRYGETYIKI